MTSDPPRLLDDPTAGAALRADLAQASEAQLHGFDLAAGLAKLQSATGTGAVATVATTSISAKLGVAGLVVAGAAAIWLGARDPSPPTAQGSAPATVASEIDEAEPTSPEPTSPEPTSPEPKVVAPVIEATPVAPSPVDSPAIPPATETVDELRSAPVQEIEPTSESSEPARKHVRKSHASEPTPAEPPPSIDDAVIREARAVAQARAKLSGDPARALALLEAAEQEFPAGQLVEERRALAIQALAALGRHDEAKRRAEAFLAQYGKGAHAAAVRRAIAAQP